MDRRIQERAEAYAAQCRQEQEALLRTLGRLPAPTRHEDVRAAFCRNWLLEQGAADVTVDAAKNVICCLEGQKKQDIIVFAAHTDIVFPGTGTLPMREEGGRLFAPGIGDDTANLVNLLMAAKYMIQNKVKPRCTILVVANSCEEGLGNLDGTKALFAAYGAHIRAFYSFDIYLPTCCDTAVGSHRYRIVCKTAGGHSYGSFGSPSAIHLLCGLAAELCQIQLPARARTTYNIGRIEGGTTVNSIAEKAEMLYEFRSTDQSCLEEMEQKFRRAVSHWEAQGGEWTVALMGIRPGSGPVDPQALRRLTSQSADIIRTFTGLEPDHTPGSTDNNIPLSLGIPANTIGTIAGGQAHTRQEWVVIDSLSTGIKIILSLMLGYEA